MLKLGLRTKIFLGFGTVIVLFSGICIFAGIAGSRANVISSVAVPTLLASSKLERLAVEIRVATNRFCSSMKDDDAKAAEDRINDIKTYLETWKSTGSSTNYGGISEKIENAGNSAATFEKNYLNLKERIAEMQETRTTMRETEETFKEYFEVLRSAHVKSFFGKDITPDVAEAKMALLMRVGELFSLGAQDASSAYALGNHQLMERAVARFSEIKTVLERLGAPPGMQKQKSSEGVMVSSSKDPFAQTVAQAGVFRSSVEMFQMSWKASETSKKACLASAEELKDLARQLADEMEKSTSKDAGEASVILEWLRYLNNGLMPVAIILGFVFAYWISLMASVPIRKIVTNLQNASGDLSEASIKLTSASITMSNEAYHQSAELVRTSEALGEFSLLSTQNSERAQHAKVISNETTRQAEHSMGVIRHMRKAMEEIAKTTRVVDEIALQTRLLSLNASVEAVRAGAAGKGFSVVADEVRKLAAQAADASRSIHQSITSGSKLAHEVADDLAKVVDQFHVLDGIVTEISQASFQQSHGIQSMNTAMLELNDITKSNTSNSSLISDYAHELKDQSVVMKDMVETLGKLIDGKVSACAQVSSDHDESGGAKAFLPRRVPLLFYPRVSMG